MAIMQIFADQIKRCRHNYNGYGAESFTWSDVTNRANTTLYKHEDSDNAVYSDHYFLQLRIPANALAGYNVNAVRLFLRCISLNRTIPLHLYVKDTDEFESGSSSIITDSLAVTGWSDTLIMNLYNSEVSDKDAAWYVQVRIGTVSSDTDYEAYINTLVGDYTPYIEIEYTPDPCVAPTLGALAAIAETNPTLSGSGASGDPYGNKIAGYEIQYAESVDGIAWGSWAAEKTISTPESSFSASVVISSTRGHYRKWRVRTLGEAGEAYYSDWVESGVVRRNSTPVAPASVSVSPSIYEQGGITVSWSAAADADDNVAAYELQRAASSDGVSWGDWTNANTSIAALYYVDTPEITRGEYIKYRIRAKDDFSITSAYTETSTVQRNQVPAAATIDYPQASQMIYNSRPRLLITLGMEPDEQLQTITAAGYTASSAGPYASGKKLVLRRTSAADAGTVSATVMPKDSQSVAGSPASIDTAYAVPSWTDNIVAGETRIRAAHINELRGVIDVIRSYYGLAGYNWPETITAGYTSMRGWAGHIAELRSAINEVITFVNGWDSTALSNRISQPAWASLGAWPKASDLTQIRTVITQL